MNRRVIVAIFLFILCGSIGSVLLVSQIQALNPTGNGSENSNLPETHRPYKANITDCKWSGWGSPGGVQAARSFNLTLLNSGEEDMEGLTIDIIMLDANGTKLPTDTLFYGPGVIGYGADIQPFDGILRQDKSRTIRGVIITDWGSLASATDLGQSLLLSI